jgi:hypothetical protein
MLSFAGMAQEIWEKQVETFLDPKVNMAVKNRFSRRLNNLVKNVTPYSMKSSQVHSRWYQATFGRKLLSTQGVTSHRVKYLKSSSKRT